MTDTPSPIIISDSPYIRVEATNPVSSQATVSVGGVAIPFSRVTLELEAGENIRITIEAPADQVDVVALQSDTTVKVVEESA